MRWNNLNCRVIVGILAAIFILPIYRSTACIFAPYGLNDNTMKRNSDPFHYDLYKTCLQHENYYFYVNKIEIFIILSVFKE